MKNTKDLLAKNLKELRKVKKLTQEGAAEACEVTLRVYQNWEYGKSFPESDTFISISKAFDVPIFELFMDDGESVSSHKNSPELTENDLNIFREAARVILTGKRSKVSESELKLSSLHAKVSNLLNTSKLSDSALGQIGSLIETFNGMNVRRRSHQG